MAQILAFGDSITDGAFDAQGGWATRLQVFCMTENLKKDVTNDELDWVYNLGISADTTRELLARVEVEAKARKVARSDKRSVFLYAIGINDSAAEGTAETFRFDEQTFKNNLQQLVTVANTYTKQFIFVGLTPVLEELTTPIYGDCWYTNSRIRIFDGIVRQVAEENGAVYVELFNAMSGLTDLKSYFADGLHPNTKGHAWMFEQIRPVVMEALAS